MPVFNRICRITLFSLLALTCAAPQAFAQQGHHQHGGKASARAAELGIGAAVDAHGKLWIAAKESAPDGQYVTLQSSSDLGRSWSSPARIQREPEPVSADGENRPKLAFGAHGEIYISYTRPLARPFTGEIRFVRSTDGGQTFSAPITVHANRDVITHRFDSMIVDREGRIFIAWIDKRDVEAAAVHKEKYAGAALYYAVSEDGGASFKGDYKIADHSCECCRIALALNQEGKPVAFWRHVFDADTRDHALAVLGADGKASLPARATFDNWHVSACPHQGPALAYAADGTRHQVWFNVSNGEGGVFYASTDAASQLAKPVALGSAQAQHADVALHGKTIALVWRQFDGKATAILARLSQDGGATWQERALAQTQGASDQPHLLQTRSGILLAWRTQNEGVRIVPLTPGA